VDGQQVQVKEYHAGEGVGGGGFYWDADSTETENGGTVFGAATVGRWKRILAKSHTDVHEWGVYPGSTDNTSAYDRIVQHVAEGSIIRWSSGTYLGNFISTKAFKLDLNGAKLTNVSTSDPVIYMRGAEETI